MLDLLSSIVCCIVTQSTPVAVTDTADVRTLSKAPVLDGRVSANEYGRAAAQITTLAGTVRVWLARFGGFVYIAAELPDSTFYWGDDFVISMDADGSGGSGPSTGDRQWYIRRTADSTVISVVTADAAGRWYAPGHEPKPLGSTRQTADWQLATSSSPGGWSLELRMREGVFTRSGNAPRLSFRTYNDQPQGWWSWPEPPAGTPAQRVERQPELWVPLRFR